MAEINYFTGDETTGDKIEIKSVQDLFQIMKEEKFIKLVGNRRRDSCLKIKLDTSDPERVAYKNHFGQKGSLTEQDIEEIVNQINAGLIYILNIGPINNF